MTSLWLLLGLLLAAPLYALRLKLSSRRHLHHGDLPIPRISAPDPVAGVELLPTQDGLLPTAMDNSAKEPDGIQTRVMKWISTTEFICILSNSDDLIVIDLRPNSPSVPFPFPNALVLPVNLNELDMVLEHLPADKSAVFYGASNLSIFMIETCRGIMGSAPLYILEGEMNFAEVA